MKLAPKPLQEENRVKIGGETEVPRTEHEVSVRVYSSGKKAKRAIQAMQRNGWRYLKPTLYSNGQPAQPLQRKRRRPAAGALPRLVTFYRP